MNFWLTISLGINRFTIKRFIFKTGYKDVDKFQIVGKFNEIEIR